MAFLPGPREKCKLLYWLNEFWIIQGFPSITITVVSGHTDKDEKEWRDKNFSGCYHMVEFVNDRPAYEVSSFYWKGTLATKGLLLLNFSETKRMKMAIKYISGIMRQKRVGFWHTNQTSKPEWQHV